MPSFFRPSSYFGSFSGFNLSRLTWTLDCAIWCISFWSSSEPGIYTMSNLSTLIVAVVCQISASNPRPLKLSYLVMPMSFSTSILMRIVFFLPFPSVYVHTSWAFVITGLPCFITVDICLTLVFGRCFPMKWLANTPRDTTKRCLVFRATDNEMIKGSQRCSPAKQV